MKIRCSLGLMLLLSALLAACVQADPGPAPLVTAAPTQVPVSAATSTPQSTVMPTSTPTPEVRQLTTGGCCVQPSWSPDSRQVVFVDRPAPDAPAGVYAVDIAIGLSQKPQVIGRVGIYSPDRSLIANPEGAQTVVEKISTGDSWVIPNGGEALEFAPDNKHLAWEQEATTGPYDQRRNDLYLANIDGSDAVRITRVYGGGLVGWLPRGLKVVFLGRPSLEVHERTLTVLDLTTNIAADLVTAERISGVSISNGGTWLAYFITFNDDKSRDGIWIERTDGSQSRRLDLWGAYQWRDDSHLLVIPMRAASGVPFEVWEVDVASGESRQLTDAATTPLNILNGDWRVSPDGQSIVYVNSVDRNLWLLTIP